jgi:glycosyltransferase involved in cell wall biosynthesis
LLPARNASADLPRFFASAERFADAIIALDDGSTDDTRSLLEAHPLVNILLTNPVRHSYAGWNDSANRNRLLEAAAGLCPEWVISIDADESLDPTDAAALRRFLETDALTDHAYGLMLFHMADDPEHYFPRCQWKQRLFAYETGQHFRPRRFHFQVVPPSIRRSAWVKTTLRIQHFGMLTEERRLARIAKYHEVDPDAAYDHGYGRMNRKSRPDLPVWEPRPPDLPVVLNVPDWVLPPS